MNRHWDAIIECFTGEEMEQITEKGADGRIRITKLTQLVVEKKDFDPTHAVSSLKAFAAAALSQKKRDREAAQVDLTENEEDAGRKRIERDLTRQRKRSALATGGRLSQFRSDEQRTQYETLQKEEEDLRDLVSEAREDGTNAPGMKLLDGLLKAKCTQVDTLEFAVVNGGETQALLDYMQHEKRANPEMLKLFQTAATNRNTFQKAYKSTGITGQWGQRGGQGYAAGQGLYGLSGAAGGSASMGYGGAASSSRGAGRGRAGQYQAPAAIPYNATGVAGAGMPPPAYAPPPPPPQQQLTQQAQPTGRVPTGQMRSHGWTPQMGDAQAQVHGRAQAQV